MWGILCGILSIPLNIVIDLNNVMGSLKRISVISYTWKVPPDVHTSLGVVG